ncbi:MAG: FAD binding domain-containing protein [Terriglobia bacterium]
MKNFQHFNPGSLIQATTALSSKPDAWVIAGGIDLLGEMKNGIIAPRTLVNLKALPNLDYIKFSESDGLRIGAMTTLATIESHPEIRERFAVLSEAAHSVATPQIPQCRNPRRKSVPASPLLVLPQSRISLSQEGRQGMLLRLRRKQI